MSDLDKIKSQPETTRILKTIQFDWDHPEVTYTSPDQGGAASGLNDAYLFKANKAEKEDLSEAQEAILSKIGEEFSPLQKANNETPSSSSEDKVGEEESKIDKGNKETMSENTVTREEFETLQKALKESKAENALMGYGFEAELNKELAVAVASLESFETITKAFDALIARGEAEVTKAKEEAAKEPQENELSKALQEEAGKGGEAEADEEVDKSLNARLNAAFEKQGV